MKIKITLCALALSYAQTAFAHDYKIGDIVIDHPVVRATPANAPVSAGYMTIRNEGDEADTLITGIVDFAGRVEIHEMAMDGDVMKMRQLENGIEIKPGEEVVLMPGGLHIMFMQMNQQLEEGGEHTGTLTFEKAGEVEVTFNVESLKTIRKAMNADQKAGDMDHSNHGDHSGHEH